MEAMRITCPMRGQDAAMGWFPNLAVAYRRFNSAHLTYRQCTLLIDTKRYPRGHNMHTIQASNSLQ